MPRTLVETYSLPEFRDWILVPTLTRLSVAPKYQPRWIDFMLSIAATESRGTEFQTSPPPGRERPVPTWGAYRNSDAIVTYVHEQVDAKSKEAEASQASPPITPLELPESDEPEAILASEFVATAPAMAQIEPRIIKLEMAGYSRGRSRSAITATRYAFPYPRPIDLNRYYRINSINSTVFTMWSDSATAYSILAISFALGQQQPPAVGDRHAQYELYRTIVEPPKLITFADFSHNRDSWEAGQWDIVLAIPKPPPFRADDLARLVHASNPRMSSQSRSSSWMIPKRTGPSALYQRGTLRVGDEPSAHFVGDSPYDSDGPAFVPLGQVDAPILPFWTGQGGGWA